VKFTLNWKYLDADAVLGKSTTWWVVTFDLLHAIFPLSYFDVIFIKLSAGVVCVIGLNIVVSLKDIKKMVGGIGLGIGVQISGNSSKMCYVN